MLLSHRVNGGADRVIADEEQQQRNGQEDEAELAGIEEHGTFLIRRNVEKPGKRGEVFWR